MKAPKTDPKKSSAAKVRRKPERGCVRSTSRSTPSRGGASVPASRRRNRTKRLVSSLAPPAAAGRSDTAALGKESGAWRASLPTALERVTLLMPDAIAESVVQEAERFLQVRLPDEFAERLATKAHRLYLRHQHFHKMLNRLGNAGRNNLYMYMRHWTAGWLKREHYALYKKLPWSFGQGQPLPVLPPRVLKNHPDAKKTGDGGLYYTGRATPIREQMPANFRQRHGRAE